mmetsp:Transcript_115988/g.259344  ORF Transcript_115988/g.259344 Transcript_115988/m.259344 type:complete len:269 (+) Transcript_115988:547-1353(+)
MPAISSWMRIRSTSAMVKCWARRLGATAGVAAAAGRGGAMTRFPVAPRPRAASRKARGSRRRCSVSSATRRRRCASCSPDWNEAAPRGGAAAAGAAAAGAFAPAGVSWAPKSSATPARHSHTRAKAGDVAGLPRKVMEESPASSRVSSKPAKRRRSNAGSWHPTWDAKRALANRNLRTRSSSGLAEMRPRMEVSVSTQGRSASPGKDRSPAKRASRTSSNGSSSPALATLSARDGSMTTPLVVTPTNSTSSSLSGGADGTSASSGGPP